MEYINKPRRIFLSLFKLEYGRLRNQIQENSHFIWHFQRIRIDATKFDKGRIRSLDYVVTFSIFVAVVDAKATLLPFVGRGLRYSMTFKLAYKGYILSR